MALEIERKFLLKRKPDIKFDETKLISQFYCIGKPDFRIRETTIKGRKTYHLTIKKKISDLTYDEFEKEITKKEFDTKLKKAKRFIFKVRYIKKVGKLKWEVDVYNNLDLVVAEIEIPSEKYHLKLPKFIQDSLIMEVTQFRNFSNKSLSEKY